MLSTPLSLFFPLYISHSAVSCCIKLHSWSVFCFLNAPGWLSFVACVCVCVYFCCQSVYVLFLRGLGLNTTPQLAVAGVGSFSSLWKVGLKGGWMMGGWGGEQDVLWYVFQTCCITANGLGTLTWILRCTKFMQSLSCMSVCFVFCASPPSSCNFPGPN